ncbi:MAG: FHA domain-containing protein, partial [Gammaproteobacteria bacterium]|nr:FHA domain-containing protein [Gammaproteobacteria bacterium]NIR64962.1 FHA domain-containing protein [candidate division Zixibacteria bacterium]NIR96248.1 FHA domain-containing protein [Gammaproteobacteria bacterium]NIU14905.1 FHA domain-containing protein [candidate division Zixibacteria bacterium]NIV06902.1 FHA domain-containing protein [candidate division Zixibacteria bacterium]
MALLLQLTDDSAGVKLPITKQRITIGRHSDNDISLEDELVSKEHAVIEVVESPNKKGGIDFYVQDLDSTNRTYVNDKVVSLHKLRHNDVIRIGINQFKFIDEAKGELDETAQLYKTWIPGVFYTGKKKKKQKT